MEILLAEARKDGVLAGRPYRRVPGGIICRVQTSRPEGYAGVQSSGELEGGTLFEGSRQSSSRGAPLDAGSERHSRVDDVNGAEILAEGAEVPQRLEQGLCLEQVYVDALSPLPHRHSEPRTAGEQIVHRQAFQSSFVLRGPLQGNNPSLESFCKGQMRSAAGRPQDKKQLPE